MASGDPIGVMITAVTSSLIFQKVIIRPNEYSTLKLVHRSVKVETFSMDKQEFYKGKSSN
jgi:hypothetical protein